MKKQAITLKVAFYLGLALLGALVMIEEAPLAWSWAGKSVRLSWVNALFGALVGGFLALLMDRVSQTVTLRTQAGEGRALLSGALFGLVGSLFGLLGYAVLELLFAGRLWVQLTQAALILFSAFLGFRIGYLQGPLWGGLVDEPAVPHTSHVPAKLFDTSVIIDGRIGDLVNTGFIDGVIVVPQFVLDELQGIADSSDNLRRRKGRRGLDILGDLRRNPEVKVEILNRDYPQTGGVDRKLIQLAKELKGVILTTDFNLNKVAKVEGVRVLNINELANAIKSRFIPGEELEVEVIDRGEEIGQGIGYLDDGTMVVVENGRRFIGKKIQAVVNSSLQTEAGKMLFVRPKGDAQGRWGE
jgi:uncharacterized protein YacL